MKRIQAIKRCAKCYAEDVTLYGCEGGYICDACIQIGHQGRDVTTKATRLLRDADALIARTKGLDPALTVNVVAKRENIAGILKGSTVNDAETHRRELLDRLGTDCVALAIDAADSLKATNTHELMLVDQLAVAHKTALDIVDKGMLEADSVERARTLNVAVKFMDSYQRGLSVLQRLRTGGEQKIIIHHVNVEGGGPGYRGLRSGRARGKMKGYPMHKAHAAPRCGAHARTTGHSCKSPAMSNGRCRMHGGKSTGRPQIHGHYSKVTVARNRTWKRALRELKTILESIKQAGR